MEEKEKIPVQADREETGKNGSIYVLAQRIARSVYYICDMQGTLSKCEEDAMLFFDEETANRYQGLLEWLFEQRTGKISRIYLKKIDSRLFSQWVSSTAVQQIPCFGDDDDSSSSI